MWCVTEKGKGIMGKYPPRTAAGLLDFKVPRGLAKNKPQVLLPSQDCSHTMHDSFFPRKKPCTHAWEDACQRPLASPRYNHSACCPFFPWTRKFWGTCLLPLPAFFTPPEVQSWWRWTSCTSEPGNKISEVSNYQESLCTPSCDSSARFCSHARGYQTHSKASNFQLHPQTTHQSLRDKHAPSPHPAAVERSIGEVVMPPATQIDLGELFGSTLGAWVQHIMQWDNSSIVSFNKK